MGSIKHLYQKERFVFLVLLMFVTAILNQVYVTMARGYQSFFNGGDTRTLYTYGQVDKIMENGYHGVGFNVAQQIQKSLEYLKQHNVTLYLPQFTNEFGKQVSFPYKTLSLVVMQPLLYPHYSKIDNTFKSVLSDTEYENIIKTIEFRVFDLKKFLWSRGKGEVLLPLKLKNNSKKFGLYFYKSKLILLPRIER